MPDHYKKINQILRLRYRDTFITDTTEDSYFFNVSELPNELPVGKTAIKIKGSQFLNPKSELLIEFLYEPEPDLPPEDKTYEDVRIFHEAIPDYNDVDGNIIVSVNLREEILPILTDGGYVNPQNGTSQAGRISLTIAAELVNDKPFAFEGQVYKVPEEWRGLYNVKWTKELNNNFSRLPQENNSPIFFKNEPNISAYEEVTQQTRVIGYDLIESASYTSSNSGSVSLEFDGVSTNIINPLNAFADFTHSILTTDMEDTGILKVSRLPLSDPTGSYDI